MGTLPGCERYLRRGAWTPSLNGQPLEGPLPGMGRPEWSETVSDCVRVSSCAIKAPAFTLSRRQHPALARLGCSRRDLVVRLEASMTVLGQRILLSIILAAMGAVGAHAQTTINQTSCINGSGNCLTGGFLESLAVNCPAQKISDALSMLHDRSGPNLITVSGPCAESATLTIAGFNRLTIRGSGGASITRGIFVVNSRLIRIEGLTVSPGNTGSGLTLAGSQVVLDGVTVQGSTFTGIGIVASSQLNFVGNPSFVTGNGGHGLNILADSNLSVGAPVNVTNNVATGVHIDSALGFFTSTGIVISGNGEQGILVDGPGRLRVATGASVDVSNNVLEGIRVSGGFATLDGTVHILGNGGDSQLLAAASVIGLGPDVEIIGSGAIPAAIADLQSSIAFGNDETASDGVTISGGDTILAHGSVGVAVGVNSFANLTCDESSFVAGTVTVTGTNTCPSSGPSGSQGPQGPIGPQGPAGATGASGLSGLQQTTNTVTTSLAKAAMQTVTATCPSGKTALGGGGSTTNSTITMIASVPTTGGWSVRFQNTANNSQTATLTTVVMCASVLP